MESRKDIQNSSSGNHIRENLNEAILVQARLIAELRLEVDKLRNSTKRQSVKN